MSDNPLSDARHSVTSNEGACRTQGRANDKTVVGNRESMNIIEEDSLVPYNEDEEFSGRQNTGTENIQVLEFMGVSRAVFPVR